MAEIEKLLSQMTLEEKIGQLMQYIGSVFLDTSAESTGPVEQFGLTEADLGRLGSVLNFASADEMKRMQDMHLARDPNKIPMIFMMDVKSGSTSFILFIFHQKCLMTAIRWRRF